MSHCAHPTLTINKSLHRQPLVLDIPDEIEAGSCQPGDEDLRHGSHQAVWRMVVCLQGIEPSHVVKLPRLNTSWKSQARGCLATDPANCFRNLSMKNCPN